MKNCTFIGNEVTTKNNGGDGGAIYNEIHVLRVTDSTFIANKSYKGGAISNSGTAFVHFNQFVKNIAIQGSAIYNSAFYNNATVNAILNWWGTNNITIISKEIFNTKTGGKVFYNPWIILTIHFNPAIVYIGNISTVTASLLFSSNGVYHNPKYGAVPYNGSAHLKTTKGTIKNNNFVNGKATSILKNLTAVEVAKVYTTVDGQTVNKTIEVIKRY